ncbi:hypothetical protein Pst134EA_021082 [Puccinia striiformis f. sp. tritici]|uniref:hypothetical protein n=1 Tax=Puccinia striiformis f. sp. tritici TaxID=168172 RepID=UPI002007C537|nr:hypothetical protein Pst134EA_021082 [Puccinia striiformis f. sp. tritici]KAH9457198.1 hypothetical protein Pst134EA_021082 [Puccinia striiformis f. sp. tritici]
MRPSTTILYLRPPKPAPIRSPFTRPTTYTPPTLATVNRRVKKQTDFNHLVHHAIPAAAKGTSSRPAPGARKEFYFVHFKDRVKFWNITPGDRVIIADCIKTFRGSIGTVFWVDRTNNRLSLLEPEFWKEEKELGHPDLPEFVRNVPIEFEYSTVRLMAPGSNEMYYENLREVEHEAVIIPSGGKRKEIHWTRIGTRRSIYKPGKQSEGEEIIPWPVEPDWSINLQDSAKRLELLERHQKQMQEQWALETRRRNGEVIDNRTQPTSHIHSRETRKDLFASPMDTWTNTLDPSQYQDSALWLSTSAKIWERFPEYFGTSKSSKTSSSINLNALPELSVPEWEFSAGQYTRRFKTENWETNLKEKIDNEIEIESQQISKHLQSIPIDQVKRILQTASYRPTMLRAAPPTAPSRYEVRKAKIERYRLRAEVLNRERLATLDLLPALESFNSSSLNATTQSNPDTTQSL